MHSMLKTHHLNGVRYSLAYISSTQSKAVPSTTFLSRSNPLIFPLSHLSGFVFFPFSLLLPPNVFSSAKAQSGIFSILSPSKRKTRLLRTSLYWISSSATRPSGKCILDIFPLTHRFSHVIWMKYLLC